MTERYYEDGTEPTVLPHMDQRDIHPMRVCRGWSCQQGRVPCQTPQECVLEGDAEPVSSDVKQALFLAALLGLVSAVIGFTAGWLTS